MAITLLDIIYIYTYSTYYIDFDLKCYVKCLFIIICEKIDTIYHLSLHTYKSCCYIIGMYSVGSIYLPLYRQSSSLYIYTNVHVLCNLLYKTFLICTLLINNDYILHNLYITIFYLFTIVYLIRVLITL